MRYTEENPYDPNNPDSSYPVPPSGGVVVPEPSGGGGGGCGAGTFAIDIDANGAKKGAEDGECVDQAEAMRRNKLWIQQNPGTAGEQQTPQGGGGQWGAAPPSGAPNYGPAPRFDAPEFSWSGQAPQFVWGEQWQAPGFAEAMNDPGYQFRQDEGMRALQQSAAAKGVLGSGGTLKDINAWGQNFAKQEYGDVFNRALTGYNTRFGTAMDKYNQDITGYNARFGTAKDVFDRNYTGAKDEYAPQLFEWQTNAHGKDLAFQRAWEDYNRSTLSAADIWNGGR